MGGDPVTRSEWLQAFPAYFRQAVALDGGVLFFDLRPEPEHARPRRHAAHRDDPPQRPATEPHGERSR